MLVHWDNYLAPAGKRAIDGHGHVFTPMIGVIEIIAGVGVALRPRIFSYVVAAWLLGIIANLLLFPLRDLGLFPGTVALGRRSAVYADKRASR